MGRNPGPLNYPPIPDPPCQGTLPWYGANHSLPAYRFVPGLYPHPIRDPNGHSYGMERPINRLNWSPDQWCRLEPYLRGIDLFNRYYFWEAHESWESLWVSYSSEAEPAQFIQGLINITALFLKLHLGEWGSVRKLWNGASIQLEPFYGKVWMGVDVNRFLTSLSSYLSPLEKGEYPILGINTPIIDLEGEAS
jgi:hypothetical protein